MLKNIIKSSYILNVCRQNKFNIHPRCSQTIKTLKSPSVLVINFRFKSTEPEIKNPNNPFAKQSAPETLRDEQTEIDSEKRIKILHLELDVARQEGRRVPDPTKLTDKEWKELLALPTKSARSRYYAFLWQLEKKRENKEIKKIETLENVKRRREEERIQTEENGHIIYGLTHNTMFLRIYDAAINQFNNNKLIQAMQYGQKLVFDCSYDDNMNNRESINTAKQFMLSFAENRFHDDPFDLHFCNADFRKNTMRTLERHIPTLRDPEFPVNVHEKCFTEIFPKEKLVYLTPHCRNDLQNFNFDDIYIIGGIVDKVNNDPLSLAKAKKLGIRMARLPLDQYLQWSSGSGKSLTLNQMVNILLELKKSNNWHEALKHVPRRKLMDSNYEESRKAERVVRSHADKFKFDLKTWGSSKKRFSR